MNQKNQKKIKSYKKYKINICKIAKNKVIK